MRTCDWKNKTVAHVAHRASGLPKCLCCVHKAHCVAQCPTCFYQSQGSALFSSHLFVTLFEIFLCVVTTKPSSVLPFEVTGSCAVKWRAVIVNSCLICHLLRCHKFSKVIAIFKVWPWWPLRRHFERPQLSHLNTEMILKRGFSLFWPWS